MNKYIGVAAGIIVLVLVNFSILKKENHLSDGQVIYLELAPVDPRSLMQGDYMALRFKLANQIYQVLPKKKEYSRWQYKLDAQDGKVVVTVDQNGIASYSVLYTGKQLKQNEIAIRYRVRDGKLKFATNAFFFQEGKAGEYASARYGQFRVDVNGELLLVSMHDKGLQLLGINKVSSNLN